LGKSAILAEFKQWKFSAWRSPKMMDDPHNVRFDSISTLLEKSSRGSVQTRRFNTWHLVDGTSNFLLGERLTNASQIWLLEVDLIPIKVMGASNTALHDGLEVVLNDLLLSPMLGDPTLVVLEALNMIFPSSCTNSHREIISVGITFFDIGYSRTLLCPHPFHHRKRDDFPF
jgi:hypothetical protein